MPNELHGRKGKLTDKQRAFVAEYVTDMNATRAAIAAGYSAKSAASAACQLLDATRFPLVARAVKAALAEKELRAERKADDILRYIHVAMYCEPLRFFEPGDNGGWLIDEDKLDQLPSHIGCLIEEVERRSIKIGEGENAHESTKLWVKLVSKTSAMTLAPKHQLGERAVTTNLNWDILLTKPPAQGEAGQGHAAPVLARESVGAIVSEFEVEMAKLKALPPVRPPDRATPPSDNGDHKYG